MKKKEIWIVAAILVFGLVIQQVSARISRPGLQARVTVDNAVVDTFELNRDTEKTYVTPYGTNTLVIKDGQADVRAADCANQICVHDAPVSKEGETIACLPHHLLVEVTRD